MVSAPEEAVTTLSNGGVGLPSIQNKPNLALEIDIAKCFDNINHEALLRLTGYKGKIYQQLKL